MTFEELMFMREGVAKQKGIQLFREYSEPEAAAFLGVNLKTLKEMRYAKRVASTSLGPRHVRYLGLHICDLILFGDKWQSMQSENSRSESIGSPSETEARPGTGLPTTVTVSGQLGRPSGRKISK